MTDQQTRDYLAIELMGWEFSLDELRRRNKYAWELIREREEWNPLKSADDCRDCVKKIGEMGRRLAELFVGELLGRLWKGGRGPTHYELLTAPLETQCEAMVKVLKDAAKQAYHQEHTQLQQEGGGGKMK